MLNYVLMVVVISHALACLARGLSNQAQETERLRTLADRTWKTEKEGENARRIVEVIWCGLYLLVAWRLL